MAYSKLNNHAKSYYFAYHAEASPVIAVIEQCAEKQSKLIKNNSNDNFGNFSVINIKNQCQSKRNQFP